MKIYEEVTIDMNPDSSTYGEHLSEESYEYGGDVVLCHGGPEQGGHSPGYQYGQTPFSYGDPQSMFAMTPLSQRMKSAGMFGDISRQLTGLGIGKSPLASDITNLAGISGGNVSRVLGKMLGIGERMPSSMFAPITEGQTRGMKWETYQPMLEQKQQSLTQGLLQGYESKAARQASGGMAASGQQRRYETSVKDVFGKGMTSSLGDVQRKRGEAYGSVQDMIANWMQQAQKFKTGG